MLKLLKVFLFCFMINKIKLCSETQYTINNSPNGILCGTEDDCPNDYYIYQDTKECGTNSCPTSGTVIRKGNNPSGPCYGCSDNTKYLNYNSHQCISSTECTGNTYQYVGNNQNICDIDDCNNIRLFHNINEYICITACDTYEYNSICYDRCPSGKRSDDPLSSISQNIYLCRDACESPLLFFDSSDTYCYSQCHNISKKKYQDPNKVSPPYECKASCSKFSSTGYIFEKDDICMLKCPDESPYFDTDKKCIPECISTDLPYHNYGSYECKSSCGSLFEFNYVCYTSCPAGTKKSSSGNKCECLGKYETNEVSSGKNIITCENDAPCPIDKKYFFETDNKCLSETEANDAVCSIRRTLKTSPQNIQCLTECGFNEYEYVESESPSITQCLTECPIGTPYYYFDSSTNKKKCLSNCNGKYVDENTKTCYSECPQKLFLFSKTFSSSTVKGKCYTESKCPPTFPYLYEGTNLIVCLDDCEALINTSGSFLLGTALSSYALDKDINKCYENCPTGKYKYENKCVISCKDYGKVIENGECKNGCTSGTFLLEDTNECIPNDENNKAAYYYFPFNSDDTVNTEKFYKNGCPTTISGTDVYQDDTNKECYTNPSKCTNKANKETKKCVSCATPTGQDPNNEGYTIDDDIYCYKSCPNHHPILYQNKCYPSSYDTTGKKRIDGTYSYVDNCAKGYYELDSICYYGGCPENSEIDSNAVKKCKCSYKTFGNTCLGKNDPCPSTNPYIINNVCLDVSDSCDNSKVWRLISNNPENLECVSSCENYEFYYYKNDDSSTKKICISKCPDDFPYRDADGSDMNRCRKACDGTTRYTNEYNHMCYTDCPGSGLSLFNTVSPTNKGNCISESSCPNTAPYLFKSKKTCLVDCQNTESNTLFDSIKTYLNPENNECVTSCPNLIDKDEKVCVDQCLDGQKIDKITLTNKEKCVDVCAETDAYYVSETGKCLLGSDCGEGKEYYIDSDSANKKICYKSCPSTYYHDDTKKICYENYNPLTYIKDIITKEVVATCDTSTTYTGDSINYCCDKFVYTDSDNKIYCYDRCPDWAPYYNYGTKICRKDCSDTPYIILKESTNECIQDSATACGGGIFNGICYKTCPEKTIYNSNNGHCECVDKYYERAIDSSNKKIECLNEGDACPQSKPYLDGKKCFLPTATNPGDPISCNTDSQREITVNGVINYECIASCNSDEYKYSSNPVKCVSKCPEAVLYHVLLSDSTNDIHRSCMDKATCQTKKYYIDETNFICYDKCPGLATIDETADVNGNMKPNNCILENDCPSSYPYLYETFCLSDCSITNKYTSSLFANKAATKLDATTKKCVNACDTTKQYYDKKTDTCVQSCRNDQYISGNNCYDTEFCEGGAEKVIYGTHKCVGSDCPDDYSYSFDKYCYKKCPDGTREVTGDKICLTDCSSSSNGKIYINVLTNKCSTCGDVGEYYVPNVSPLICYSKCPTSAPYYLSLSNKCYSTGCPVDDNTNGYSDYKYLNPKTNECMNSCSDFEFNNVCYSDSCPDLTVLSTSNKCVCVYNYYVKNLLNICLDVGEPCPSGVPYIRTNGKCDISCDSDGKYIRKISSSPINYECLKSCNSDEFVYKETDDKKYCLKKCPEVAQFYLANPSGEKLCGISCSEFESDGTNTYYTDEINHICYSTCPGLMTINEGTETGAKDKCISDINCPTNKPYLYKNKYCLADCASTKKSILDKDKTTDEWILDKSTNQCIENTNSCKFIDESGDCVEKCGNSQFTYFNGKKCYNKCPSTSTSATDPKYTVDELKQCVINCDTVKYYSISGDYKCYKTCPSGYNTDDYKLICYASGCSTEEGDAKILKVSYGKCIKSCDIPKNKNYLQIQEGYLYGTSLCLDKCPNDKPYIIKGSNICYEKGNSALRDYILINGTNEYIQKDSDKCPTGYYLFNNLCYTSCPENSEYDAANENCDCSFKFYKTQDPLDSSNTNYKVCLGPNEFCPNADNNYVLNNECVSSTLCSSYKKRKIYFNPLNYECISSCESDEFEYDNYCLKQCPESSPYHVFGKNKCYSSCDDAETDTTNNPSGNKYFSDKENYICYIKCPEFGIMKEDDNPLTPKECVHGCSQGMYLYDIDNICLSSCSLVSLLTNPKEVKVDEENKKCVSSCGAKYLNKRTTLNECVDVCPEGSFIYQKTCLEDCSSISNGDYLHNTKICITDTSNYYHLSDDDNKYYESCPLTDGTNDLYPDSVSKLCKPASDCTSPNHFKKSNHKCVACTKPVDLNSIKDDEGFIGDSSECLEGCPSDFPYYIGNICKDSNGVSGKIKIENTNEYIDDTADCPDLYYLFNKVCYKSQCPENTYYDNEAKICKCSYKFTVSNGIYLCFPETRSCPSDHPYFEPDLTESNKGCVDNCGNKKIKKVKTSTSAFSYECVTDCSIGEFVYKDSSSNIYCVEKCPEDKKYHVFGKNECRADCDQISGEPDTYYTDNSDLTCRINCEGLKTLSSEDTNGKKGECISGNKCPNDLILYADEKVCLSDCRKTTSLTNIFPTSITYLHDDTVKQCLTKCSIMLTKRYISGNNCVEKCADDEKIYDFTCKSNCQDSPTGNSDGNYIAETKECTNVKPTGYYIIHSADLGLGTGTEDSLKFFKECPETNFDGVKLYSKKDTTNADNNYCVSCKAGTGENNGFYIENDPNRICYSSCPNEAKYYIKGDNKCINDCASAYPYQYKLMDTNECVEECPSVDYFQANYECYRNNCPQGFKRDGSTNKCICDTTTITGSKFYKSYDTNNNEILICITDATVNCPADKPYLTYNQECVADCPSDYKIKDEEEKKCYASTCPQGKYLKESINKCISDCKVPVNKGIIAEDEGYYITKVSSASDASQKCFDECPSNTFYHNVEENQCISSCAAPKPNVVMGKNVCVNNCPEGYYLFNEVCYESQCPENTEFNSVNLVCKCKYKYTKNLNKYECLAENEPCPQEKNYYDETKECTNSCDKKLRKLSTDADDYQCLNECFENEFLYNDGSHDYCVATCSNDKPYHLVDTNDCIESCSDFTDEINKICYSSCPNLHTIDEGNGEPGKYCLQGNKCPIEPKIYYYYEKTKTCISKCDLTSSIAELGREKSYTTSEPDPTDNTLRVFKCVTDCSTNVYKTLTDTINDVCVEKCGENDENVKFLYEKKCYSSCGTIPGGGGAGLTPDLYLEDTKECVKSCPDGYYTYFTDASKGICYKKCPNFSTDNTPVELFTKTVKKICVSCTVPSNTLDDSEGYKVIGDTAKTCYEKCPNTAPYYDAGKNICFDGGCRSSNNPDPTMLYSNYNDGSVEDYKCYATCQDAVGSNDYSMTEDNQCIKGTTCPVSYPYLYSGVCYKNKCPSDNLITYKNNGIYECQSSCTKDQYLEGNKCVISCGSDYPYILEKTDTVPGICFTVEEKCSTTINQYYNEISKKCSADCSGYKIESDPITGRSKISIQGTCVSTCPDDFPYLYDNICYKSCPSIAPFIDEDDKFTCLKNCAFSTNQFEYNGNKCVSSCNDVKDKYYIEYSESSVSRPITRKVCVNKCTSPQQYYFASNGKCLQQCQDRNLSLGPSYYNPITFECVDSCSSVYGYQFYVANKPSACLSKCDPNTGYGYYYDSIKECKASCDHYYSSVDSHICVQNCGTNEFIIPENKKCVTICPADYPYQVTKNEGSNIVNYCFSTCQPPTTISGFESYKYILNKSKKCTTKCEGTEKYLFGNICNSKCPDLKPYYEIKNSSNGIYKCLSSCDESTNNKYHNKNNYECINKCTGDKKYYIVDTNTCLDSCPSSYPYETEKSNGIECNDKCTGYLSGKVCSLTSCDLNIYPYYVQALKKCFSYCPEDFPYRKKNTARTPYTYECVKNCGSEYINDNECVSRCPQDKNYIGKNNICKALCEGDDGNYYSNMDPASSTPGDYNVYTCSSQCNLGNFLYHTIREYECFQTCQDKAPYKAYDFICYSSCKENKNYPFSIEINTNDKQCVPSCSPYTNSYYDEDYNCIPLSSCTGTKTIDQNNKCVEKCDFNSEYKFKESATVGSTYNICKISCSSTTPRFYKPEYVCLEKCNENDYVREDGECEKSCDPDSYATFGDKNDKNEIVCKESCSTSGKEYYYLANKLCIAQCDTNDFVIEGTKQCVTECGGDFPYKYKTDGDNTYTENTCVRKCTGDKKFTLSNGECAENCPSNSPYYLDSDKKCLYKCPEGFSQIVQQSDNSYQCVNGCEEDKFILNNECVTGCPTEVNKQRYYFEKTKECLYTCGSGFYKNEKKCVDICPSNQPYDDGTGTCVDNCPNDRKYYVKDIKPEEADKQMHCLSDCPTTHPFFINNDDEHSNDNKACYENCPQSEQIYHVKTLGKIAKECKTECSESNGPGNFVGDNGECLQHCPNSKHFYLENQTKNIKCLEKCPDDTYYSPETDSNLCSKTCNKYIYKKEKTCLNKCKSNQYTYKDTNNQLYCLDECDGEFSITPKGECVKECPSTDYLVKNPDPNSNKCICQKLYYYDETTGIMTCLKPTINDCRSNTDNEYTIPIKNSEECLKTCKTILSSDGFCLEKYECPSNSVLTTKSDYSQYCKCKYKFYKNEFNKNICLDKDEDCPAKFNYLIYETNECVETCIDTGYEYFLSNYCIAACPSYYNIDTSTTDANGKTKNICKCAYKWILNDDNIEECLGPDLECPQSKPLFVEDTKQCVTKCPNIFPIIFNGKCLSKCDKGIGLVKVAVLDADISLKQYGNYTCQCENLWYYDISGNVICSETKRTGSGSCPDINNIPSYLKYLVKDTGQCILTCPDLYHFKFNFDCFSDCDINANSYYKDNLEKKSNTECQCKNAFKTISTNGNDIISCIEYEECNLNTELYVVNTEECISSNICPVSYPILFNRKCYDTCPENSYYTPQTDNSCSCKYLWYQATNSITGVTEIICMKEEEKNCPESKPYLNTNTNKCTDDSNEFEYIFNNKGYKNGCPLTTKESSITIGNTKKCECDKVYGPWYKDDSDQNDYYYCGLDECPKDKPYKKSDTKECLYSCKDLTDYVVFKKICYPVSTGCPGNSEIIDTTSNICEYKPLLESTDFNDFHSKFQNDILYYYEDAPDGGIVYEAYGVSTQLVGIGKKVEDYKNFTMKGNLTYIDFGKCMDKIYEANGLNDEEKIILLKFDSVTIPVNYLIHPVEYEAYSSRTGERIDLSICDINDIVISYPISELLNSNTKSLRSLADANNFKELFNLAKKLNDEYSNIDSFNPNSVLYKDLCQECVIDGKDLILKDRVSYLYPENASLCESNCTFLSTDFEKERVYCKCTYKLEIIKDRKQSKYISNFTQEEIDNYQKGPTNFPILKCIKKFEVSHNGAFFYMIVVLILEFVLCGLTFSLGYIIFEKKISLVFYGKKEETENTENDKNNKNSNENDANTENKHLKIASSERKINENKQANPPKNPVSRQTEEDNLEIKIDQNQKTKSQSNAILYRRNLKNVLEEPRKMLKNNYPLVKYFQDDIYSKYEKTSSEANYQRDIYDDENLLTILRKEKRNKELLYETAIEKDKENTPIIVLTFIVDKIYFTKTLFFTRKYNIFSALASLYILYHVLVLSLITMFFNVKTISKMFFEKNYPNISFYLLYGLICNIIAWFIYRLLGCLIKNNNKVINFIARWKKMTEDEKNNENKNNINNINNIINNDNNNDNNQVNVENEDYEVVKRLLDYRYNKFKKGVIVRLIIYYIIEWAILLFCFFYLCIFCSVYVSTKNEVFKTYGISLFEIFLIKIVYAVILGCLRSLSLVIESRKLYVAIKFFDFYLS